MLDLRGHLGRGYAPLTPPHPLAGLGDLPYALGSDGKGSQTPGKSYLALYVHADKLTAAPTGTAKNANGTYNNCPVDIQCWVPVDATWYPITK